MSARKASGREGAVSLRACRIVVLAATVILGSTAMAQKHPPIESAGDYPARPVRWIIDFGAGGLSDTLARLVAQKLTEAWLRPVINQPRPGANGTIAYDTGAKATPDGYTLVFLSTPFSINVSVYASLSYDTRKDFAPVSRWSTPAQFRRFLEEEIERWAPVAREAGVKLDR